MLEIVCQTGGLVRVVARTGTHGDVGLDFRSVFVNAHEDFKTVVQGVLADVQRVVGIGLVLIGFLSHHCAAGEGKEGHKTADKA